jgi:hypothetical protein
VSRVVADASAERDDGLPAAAAVVGVAAGMTARVPARRLATNEAAMTRLIQDFERSSNPRLSACDK